MTATIISPALARQMGDVSERLLDAYENGEALRVGLLTVQLHELFASGRQSSESDGPPVEEVAHLVSKTSTATRRRAREWPETGLKLRSYELFALNLSLQNPNARLVLVNGGDAFKAWASEAIRPSVDAAEIYGLHLYVVDMSDVNHYAALRKTDFIVAG